MRTVEGVQQGKVTPGADLEDSPNPVGAAVQRGSVEVAVGALDKRAKRIAAIQAGEGVQHAESACRSELINGAVSGERDAFISRGKGGTTSRISVEVAVEAGYRSQCCRR